MASLEDTEQVPIDRADYSDRELLNMLSAQVDWLCTAMTQVGNTTAQTQAVIGSIMNALMASPMGAGIRKQMEALNNGR